LSGTPGQTVHPGSRISQDDLHFSYGVCRQFDIWPPRQTGNGYSYWCRLLFEKQREDGTSTEELQCRPVDTHACKPHSAHSLSDLRPCFCVRAVPCRFEPNQNSRSNRCVLFSRSGPVAWRTLPCGCLAKS